MLIKLEMIRQCELTTTVKGIILLHWPKHKVILFGILMPNATSLQLSQITSILAAIVQIKIFSARMLAALIPRSQIKLLMWFQALLILG